MQNHLGDIGRGGIGDGAHPAQIGVNSLAPKTLPAMTSRAVAGEQRESWVVSVAQRRLCGKHRGGAGCGRSARVGGNVETTRAGRNAAQITDQRSDLLRRQILQAVAHDFGHRPGGRCTSFRMARFEIRGDLLVRPGADAVLRIGGDVVGLPALHFLAGELAAVFQAEAEIPRRVAFRTMAKRGGQVGATVPLRRLRIVTLEALVLEEPGVPEAHRPALVERKAQLVRPPRLLDRGQTE